MKKFLVALALSLLACGNAQAGRMFMGAYPDLLLVFDEAKGTVVDRIHLETGLSRSIALSQDRKVIYVTTITNSGIEVVDVATHKVLKHFELNTPGRRFRFNSGVASPNGKLFYAIATQSDKLIDRFEVQKPRYVVIDMDKGEVIKSYPMAQEDENSLRGGLGNTSAEVSADGKFLYMFGEKVIVLDTSDFKVVERMPLARAALPGLENGSFSTALDSMRRPGQFVSLFNAADPIVHNRVFGVARFDLATRRVDFTPIGPSPQVLTGLQIAPNNKDGYVVVSTGTLGNKRCEFWHIDLATNVIQQKSEFACKSRFSFGMSGDGRKLYIYGASFEMEVFNAATLKLEKTWDLGNDITGAGLVIIN